MSVCNHCRCVVFVDDLNMPQKEKYGAQPPIELLRQWVDHKHWYDKKDNSRLELADVVYVICIIVCVQGSTCSTHISQNLVCAMGPPGGGRNAITNRFTRHFNLISIESFDDSTMTKIFSSMVDWHFGKGFDPTFLRLGKVNAVHSICSDSVLSHYSLLADNGTGHNGSVQGSGQHLPPHTLQVTLCVQSP